MDAELAENGGRAATPMDRPRNPAMGKSNNPFEGATFRLHQPSKNDLFSQYRTKEPFTPSSWFSHKFPDQQPYGSPFLEAEFTNLNGLTRITPVAINEDFFAAILGGNQHLKHKVIFHLPERKFLFLDWKAGYFVETTEEKLKLLLSQLLLKCAQEMPPTIDLQNLFLEFRHEKTLNSIIKKARGILAADENFWKTSPCPRKPQKHEELAILFSKTAIEFCPAEILTVNQCYESFTLYCISRGAEAINRHDFNGLMKKVLKREFKLGLRHDLIPAHQKTPAKGWKGLRRCGVEVEAGVEAEVEADAVVDVEADAEVDADVDAGAGIPT